MLEHRLTYQSVLTSVETDVYRILADPLRLRIAHLLAAEALCVCHLVAETGARQTNLSNHLRVMRRAGIVETEPCGRFVYYRLRPEAVEAVARAAGALAGRARETARAGRRRPCP
jgi:ArsR family transcriptional regulator